MVHGTVQQRFGETTRARLQGPPTSSLATGDAQFIDQNRTVFQVTSATYEAKVVPDTATCTDVRTALLNLQSSAEQVNVARSNIDLAEKTLAQSSDRFSAGVTDTVEVVQSQEAVASAHEQYISSLYSYNYAKISLVRALGTAEQGVQEYFRGK